MHQSDYVSLHLHTEYSLLDGAVRIDELVEKTAAYKMPAVAVTDHGNLFGAVEFYKKALDSGVKPVIGCEVYVAQGSRFDRGNGKDNGRGKYFHLVLLAKDMDGYKNLVSLVSKAYLEGFYYRPRIDIDLLEQYSGGLIGLTACLKGEVPYYLQRDMIDDAREAALRYKHILGPGNLYLELQDNGIAEQIDVNRKLVELSKELNIKLVATNDTHYLKKEDSVAHDILLCIQTGKTVYDTDRMRFKTDGLYFKSPEEMKAAFSEIPEAVLNTREVADKCNLTFNLYKNMLPHYSIEGGLSPDDYMERLARTGIKKKLGSAIPQQYMQRFETELKIIKKMGFSSYFLIVWDFINYARTKDIPVGPGRGSAAGSLIAYSLDITDIDPLKYNLLFERFLNPDRISMPDIDVDFCKDKRGEVINYTAEKFGKDHVAQIITFGTMAAKASIRDVGRALAMPYAEVDKIAKLIPSTLNITIKEGLEAEPELKAAYDKSEDVRRLIDIAMRLEGLCRHASTHAAGVVISPAPLTDYTPLYKHPSEDAVITQFDMNSIEKIGLLKFDFLGLKTLTVIQKTLEYLDRPEFDLKHISFDDKATYDLLSSGLTTGIFQLESPGMRDILTKMAPNRFEDLIALVALYRPGPIGSGMIDDFIKRKKGQIPVQYELPELQEILDETYGVILYQEQVMRIANKLAGFSMGQADILRKAMGKKIIHEMDKQKDAFVTGSVKNGIKEKIAVKIFDLMAQFAKYGFNKSHSAAYAYIAYQTAYLKAHFPVEFMAANLSCEDGSDKVVKFIKECHEMSIEILPPDINKSHSEFTIIGQAISFGLEAVKGVGSAAIESILDVRQARPFSSLEDFVVRVDSRKVNKKVIESLIKAGSFDLMIKSRAMAFDSLDLLLSGTRAMPSLFGDPLDIERADRIYEWQESEKLGYEKQALGFYISSHPLRRYEGQLRRINISRMSALDDTPSNEDVRVAGIITSVKKKQLKDKKGQMAILNVEDDEVSMEAIVFPDVFQRTEPLLKKDSIVIITGRHDSSEKGHKIIVSAVSDLQKALDERYSRIEITLDSTRCSHDTFVKIKGTIQSSKGLLPVYLRLYDDEKETVIATSYCASNDIGLIDEIEAMTHKGAVQLS